MKKLLFIFLLINLFIYPIFSKDVVIDTPYGEKTVIVPDTKANLEEAFLELMVIYFEQKNDIEILLENKDTLEDDIEKLQTLYVDYEKLFQDIYDIKTYKEIIRQSVQLSASYSFATNTPSIAGGYGIILFDNFQITGMVSTELKVTIQLGILF